MLPAISARDVAGGRIGQLAYSFCTGQAHCELATSQPNGSSFRLLTRNEWWAAKPSWSPDGQWIAFQIDGGEGQGIYVIRASGGGLRRVARSTDKRPAYYPCWMDKRTVGFTYGRFFATFSLDDSEIETHRVAWTADCGSDGKTIAFPRRIVRSDIVIDQVVVGKLEDKSVTVLAQGELEFSVTTFSPDGRQVAFCVREPYYGAKEGVAVARTDGAGKWRRVRSMSCVDVAWTPSGDGLVVEGPCYPDCFTLVDIASGRPREVTVGHNLRHVDWRT